MTMFLLFALGASLGSFCNVCIYRIPRGIDVVKKRSYCPHCGITLRWFELVPVLSYLLLKGRCSNCRSRISLQYPAVEVISGLLFVFFAPTVGAFAVSWAYLAFILTMMVIAFTDWQHLMIPNRVLIASFIAALLLFSIDGIDAASHALLSSAISGAIAFATLVMGNYAFRKETMGAGDVKLAGIIGLYIGWKLFLLSFWISAVIGAVYGITLILLLKRPAETRLPFGSFLAVTSCVVVLMKPLFEKVIGKWLMLIQ